MRIRYSPSLFYKAGRRSIAGNINVQKDYFFVDTNVIIAFRKKEFGVEDFIKDPNHQFFYTETVLNELKVAHSNYPESDPSRYTDSYFNFVHSKISLERKNNAIDTLDEIWHAVFSHEKNLVQKGFGLSSGQLNKFKNDLFVIFEASDTCHRRGVLPDDDLRTPNLLTNMHLLNKFLLKPRAADVLEQAINLSGFEHLIPTLYLEDVVEAWKALQPIQNYRQP